jgi:predicted transcriptional regulator
MTKRVVTAHLPVELAEKLDGLADRLDRPRGWLVQEALQAYIGLQEERHRETLAALDEVDAGQVIPHAQVRAWTVAAGNAKKGGRRAKRKV